MSFLPQYPEYNGFLAITTFSKISQMKSSEQIPQKTTFMGNFWQFFMSSEIHIKMWSCNVFQKLRNLHIVLWYKLLNIKIESIYNILMLRMTRNTLFEKMDFGKCYGGDIVQKKTVSPIYTFSWGWGVLTHIWFRHEVNFLPGAPSRKMLPGCFWGFPVW